jgi:TonB-linked SusC/RagA family outer membrane protein
MRKRYIFLLMFTIFISTIKAQEIPVSGTVTSATDAQAIPGVTIVVKGTARGTATDLSGNYTISVPSDGTLVFSFVGFQKQEVLVNGQKKIDIVLAEEKFDLGEVVVVGYGTDSKKLISGSIDLVGEEEIKNIPVRTIDGVLQGRTAGMTISPNSGTPGGQPTIKLRGGSSINASNQPLFVIDGIPAISGSYGQVSMSGQEISALSDINPNDIESITVLKDASATAIYGSRASNGVILITTKKGSYQKTTVSLNTNYGWQQLPPERLLDLMNAAQYNEYAGTNIQGIDTDWMSEVLQVAPTTNTELSVSSGNDKTRIFLSGSYYKQDGVIKGASYDRYSGRLNVDQKLLKNLTIGGGVSISYSKNERIEGDATLYGPLPNAMSIPAIYPVYTPEGKYDESHFYANPVAIANEAINHAYTNRTNGNVYLEYKFFDGFTFSSKWGADIYSLREHSYDPVTERQGAKYNGLGIEGTSYVSNLIATNTLQYSKSIDDKHNFEALAGYSFEKYASRSTYIDAVDFPNENFQYIASAGTIRSASASALDRGLNSVFGQIKYNYKYKYIFSLTARADGSSKFGENNRYGYFPAVSVAWRASEENFMKPIKVISDLKFRVSYGLTGNDGIGDYASLGLYGGGYNYGGESGTAPIQLPNPDLKWESTAQTGFGFDLGLLADRINLNADFYFNKTKDLLLDRPIPPSSGFTAITSNIGTMQNMGMELILNALAIDKTFKWNISLNFSANRNEVTSLYEDQPIDDLGRGGNRVEVGQPIGIFYGYRCLGVDPTTGNLVYDDVDKDGQITSADRTKTGDPNPDFMYGVTNVFTYKALELSVFLQGTYGNDIYNGTMLYLGNLTAEDNQITKMLNRWKNPGDITDVPRVGDQLTSSRFLEDGSFMRIKNVTLAYNFTKSQLDKVRIKSAKLYASVQNLYTFTEYSGMDPEVNYYGASNVIMGTDFFTYPQSRTILIGLNLGF